MSPFSYRNMDLYNALDAQYIETNELGYNEYIDDIDDIVDEIAEHNARYINEEIDLQTNEYVIGAATYFPNTDAIVVASTVSVSTLLAYHIEDIQFYLAEYSCMYHRDMLLPEVHIIKIFINPDGVYTCILKTFWIKWIQRAWKKQYAKRKELLHARSNLLAQIYFEVHGSYPPMLQNIPSIHGLLRTIL